MGWKFLQPFQFEDQDDDNKGWAELVASEIYSAKVDVVPIPAGTDDFSNTILHRNGILLPKLFLPWENIAGREFAIFLRSLVQFIKTVKGQNNFW